MAVLSPKAAQYVAFAMEYAPERDRAIWKAADRDTSKDLPEPVVRVALSALQNFEGKLQARLDTPGLGEDETADLSNDLGTVQAIERGLERQITPAYAMAARRA